MRYNVKYKRRCHGAIGIFLSASIVVEANDRHDVFSILWQMEDDRGYEIVNMVISTCKV